MINRHTPINARGFTIVELLVVIVVIGILAAIVIVSYGGVQKSATASVMKDLLQSTGQKFKADNLSTEIYPITLPAGTKTPAGVGLALAVVMSEKEFCINVTSQKYADLMFNMTQKQELKTGLCEGAIIAASVVGDYRAESVPVSSAVTINGTSGGFKITTDESWSQITMSWNAVSNATQYEIQSRTPGGTWYNRTLTNGSTAYDVTAGGGTTGNIPSSTTSLTWTHANGRPTTAGQSIEYRYRAYVSGTPGAWSDATLTVPNTASMGSLTSFTVNPDLAWSNITLAWAAPNGFTNPANVVYEIQTRGTDGIWYARTATNGSGTYSGGGGTSGSTPLTTTSYTWTHANVIPQTSGTAFDYRARVLSNSTPAIYGPWSNVTITAPTTPTLSAMNSFTVVPNGTWSNIVLTWAGPSGLDSPSNINYEIQTRIAGGTWYARAVTNGAGSYSGGGATSGLIPLTDSTYTWTNSASIPSSGQSHEYRARVKSTSVDFVYGPWTSLTLNRP